jgi:hypothetical protein
MGHSWNTGWVPIALAALRQDSIKFRPADVNRPPKDDVAPTSYPQSVRWLYK